MAISELVCTTPPTESGKRCLFASPWVDRSSLENSSVGPKLTRDHLVPRVAGREHPELLVSKVGNVKPHPTVIGASTNHVLLCFDCHQVIDSWRKMTVDPDGIGGKTNVYMKNGGLPGLIHFLAAEYGTPPDPKQAARLNRKRRHLFALMQYRFNIVRASYPQLYHERGYGRPHNLVKEYLKQMRRPGSLQITSLWVPPTCQGSEEFLLMGNPRIVDRGG